MRISRLSSLRPRLLCAGAVLIIGALPLSGCTEVEETSSAGYEPAKLEPVKGNGEVQRVSFTPEGARRIGLQTAPVRSSGPRKVVPYAALIYDAKGKTYVYTSPRPLTFVREQVEVDRIGGRRVLLSDGPAAGTVVVTVGATEVYGTEYEVGH